MLKNFLRKILGILNDEQYIKLIYWYKFGRKVNLDNPKTFNEKLQWLKINDRKEIYVDMVDKIKAKDYISNLIGNEYIVPTLMTYNSTRDIDFDKLPKQFVMKCTHDSGGLVICKDIDLLDRKKALKKIKKSFKSNYYYVGREWPYKKITPRIIVEEYLGDGESSLNDYKLFCFNGKVKVVLVCSNRFVNLEETFFDENWNILEVKRPGKKINLNIKKPVNFEKMKKIAENLTKDIPFIRVDFYECKNKIYVGELTFFTASGFSKFKPEEWDIKLGDMLVLPEKE